MNRRRGAAQAARAAAQTTPTGRVVLAVVAAGSAVAPVVTVLLVMLVADGAGPASAAAQPQTVPPAAADAYLAAAASAEAAGCRLRWTLLAAIGQVESAHGTAGWAMPATDGQVTPPLVGPVLDGTRGVAAVADTDDGRLDGEVRWDRAVGPMQPLPATWAVYATDGDADGQADPYDLDDAAAAAAALLCAAADGDVTSDTGMRKAVGAYNPSEGYAAEVARWTALYQAAAGRAQKLAATGGVSNLAAADLAAGRVDARLVGLLAAIRRRHHIRVAVIRTGHSQCVGGGSRTDRPGCVESHHWYGRGADIDLVDGQPVSADSGASAALVGWLAGLDADDPLRPVQVGSPHADFEALPGFFTDADHQAHVHVAVCGPRLADTRRTDDC